MKQNKYSLLPKEKTEAVRNELVSYMESISGFEEDYKDSKLHETVICYFLWKLKTNPKIKTPDDLASKGCFREKNHYATMIQDDCLGLFYENEPEWKRLLETANKYSSEELASAILNTEFIEEETYEKYFANLPVEIGELADSLLNIKADEKVLDIFASSYPLESRERNDAAKYEVFDEDNYPMLTLISCLADIMGYSEMAFRSNIEGQRYDKIMINNAMESSDRVLTSDVQAELEEAWEDFPSELSNEWNMCAHALCHLNKGGKIVAIMNGGQLTVNRCKDARKYLCDKGLIEGVIALPDKMYSETWVNPYLIVIGSDNKRIRFMDMRDEYVPSRKKGKRINKLSEENIETILKNYKKGDNAIDVKLDEIKENDYILSPMRYRKINDQDVKTIKLEDAVVEIKRGMTLAAKDMDQSISADVSEKKVILPANIANGIVTTNLYYHGDIRKQGKNEARQGNVLVSKTGNPFSVAVARDNYLVVGNTYILNIDSEKLDPDYLKCFLSSEMGQKEMGKYATGAATPIISVSNLLKIEIPIYEGKTQKELNRQAKELVQTLEECNRQINVCNQEIETLFG